jgi:type IV fimbrial biogenesis protein FimT
MSNEAASPGFTLVELLTALAILAILLAVGVPSLLGLIQENRMRNTVNSLTLDFTYARSESIKRVSPVVVCKSPNGLSCLSDPTISWAGGWIVFVDADRNNDLSTGEVILLVRDKLKGDLRISTSNFQNYIAFRPDGSSNTFGHFKIEDKRGESSQRLVCVASTGRVRAQSSSACNA